MDFCDQSSPINTEFFRPIMLSAAAVVEAIVLRTDDKTEQERVNRPTEQESVNRSTEQESVNRSTEQESVNRCLQE